LRNYSDFEEILMAILTLTTDFGTEDGNVGVMKGVIWGICPQVQIADLSHQIGPQNIRQAAFVLARQVFYFPSGTIHVVVIDPGVGTKRRPLAAQIGDQYFIGPDNGVFTPLYRRAEKEGWTIKIVHTNRPTYWLDEISHVFHGRDIFSPVGAYLAFGIALEELGEPISDPVRIDWPRPKREGSTLIGEITHIDHFGNMFVNITKEDLSGLTVLEIGLGEYRFMELINAFGERMSGELVALYSSTNEVLIAEVNGSAAKATGGKVGDTVWVKIMW
jgi:S-adenosylmethionine hydrolase